MIISCEAGKLNTLVQTVLRAVSSRVTMPILSGLLLNAEGGKLTMSGTDLEMSIKARIDANVKEGGTAVVSGRLLGDIVKSLPSGEVTIETGEKFLDIKTEVGEYRIREMMPEDFPQVPEWEGQSVLKVESAVFVSAVHQTSRASSNDEKRPVLTGSLIEKNIADASMRIVATDSYRLAWKEFEVNGSVSDWEDCIIPTKTLNEVARIAGTIAEPVEMKVQDKQVMFKLGEMVVTSRLIEGQFPNYKQLVPKGEKTTVMVDKEELTSVVKRALIFGHNLRLAVYSEGIRIVTETPEVGDSKEELKAEIEGEEMEIGFNGAYMMDGISGVETEKVRINMDDPQKPALVKDAQSEKYSYILMPVRLR
jgi:DNA polymerase-3 subunit beta